MSLFTQNQLLDKRRILAPGSPSRGGECMLKFARYVLGAGVVVISLTATACGATAIAATARPTATPVATPTPLPTPTLFVQPPAPQPTSVPTPWPKPVPVRPTAEPTPVPIAAAASCQVTWTYSSGQIMASVTFQGPAQVTVVAHYPDGSDDSSISYETVQEQGISITLNVSQVPSSVEALTLSGHGNADCFATSQS
jgi:hypothetical protein